MPQSNAARAEASGFDDPVHFPFSAEVDKECRRELYVALLVQPELLDDHLQGWIDTADGKANAGGVEPDPASVVMAKAIIEANPWMRDARAKVDQSMVKDGPGWTVFAEWRKVTATDEYVTTPERSDALILNGRVTYVNVEYRKYATAYVYVLDCLRLSQVSAKEAVNWNMLPQGSIMFHRAGMNDRTESREALWFEVVLKDGRSGLVGVNLFDKRIEFPTGSRPPATSTTTPDGDDPPPPGGNGGKDSSRAWYPGSGTVPPGTTTDPSNPACETPIPNVGNEPGQSSGGTVNSGTPVTAPTDTEAPGAGANDHASDVGNAADGGQGNKPIQGGEGEVVSP